MSQVTTRFEGASWYNIMKQQTAIIAGAGATGSFFSFFLARAGLNRLMLVDDDKFEAHNIGKINFLSFNTFKR